MLSLCHRTKNQVLSDDSVCVMIIVINVISLLIAAPGNIITMTVIAKDRKLRKQPTYLFIGSVCLADALVATISQPLYITALLLESSDEYCALYISFFVAAWLSAFGSVIGINAITLDRFFYIFYPLKYPKYMKRSRAIILVILTWSIALIFAVVPVIWLSNIALHSFLLCHNAVSCVLVAATYYKVYKKVCNTSSNQSKKPFNQSESSKEETNSQRQATRTVLIVVIFFIGCWGPWTVLSFVMSIKELIATDIRSLYKNQTFKIAESLSLTGGFMSSAYNVFIYTFKNKMLKKEWIKFICGPFKKRKLVNEIRMNQLSLK